MPRKPKKQAPQPEAAKSYDEFADDAEGGDEEVAASATSAQAPAIKLRDWRDVEKYKEERLLRRLVDDDLDLLDDTPRTARRR